MSLKSNYSYIRDWINTLFLKKTDIDLTQYYTKNEVNNEVDSARVDTTLYVSKDEYQPDEEVVASALKDLNSKINSITEDNVNGFVGEKEEKVIALALTDLDTRVSASAPLDSPQFTGAPLAPTANAGTNTTQIATTAFVNMTFDNNVSMTGVTLNGTAPTITNKIGNLTLTTTDTGIGSLVSGISVSGNVITVNKTNAIKVNSGTTRPSLESSDVGYCFFDTSLNKPLWWNGSEWKDATGATVS